MSEPISTSDKISKKTTVEDKLGNNDSRIEIFDSVNAAKKAAIQILKDLDRISKIILISSYAKISLDDMDVKIFTGLKRDALYRRIKILKENIKSQIKTLLKINSQEELADMNKFVINFLASEIFVEFSSEKPMESFLNRIEIKTEETF
jgi:C4-type Zn-finger protein